MSSTISTSRPSIGGVEVLEDPHDARGVGRRAVGGDGHEVDLARRRRCCAHQVGQEEDGALEHADQQQVACPRSRARSPRQLRGRGAARSSAWTRISPMAASRSIGAGSLAAGTSAGRTPEPCVAVRRRGSARRSRRPGPRRSRRRRAPPAVSARRARGTLRSVKRSCSERAAAEAERAHAVAGPPARARRAPARARPRRAWPSRVVVDRQVRAALARAARRPPNAARPGTASGGRRRRGSAPAALEPQAPVLDDRAQAAAEVERRAARRARRARGSPPARAPTAGGRPPARRRRAAAPRAARARAAAPASRATSPPARRAPRRRRVVEHLRLVAQERRACAARWPRRPGARRAAPRAAPWRMRLRANASDSLVASSRQASPRSRQ